jgi:hypothetical protein
MNQLGAAGANSNSEFTALRNAMAWVEGTKDTVYATGRFMVRYTCEAVQIDSTKQIYHDPADPTSVSSVVSYVGARIYWGARFGVVNAPDEWETSSVSADSATVTNTATGNFMVEVEPLPAGGFCLVPDAPPILFDWKDVFVRTDADRFGRLLNADPRVLPICGFEAPHLRFDTIPPSQ